MAGSAKTARIDIFIICEHLRVLRPLAGERSSRPALMQPVFVREVCPFLTCLMTPLQSGAVISAFQTRRVDLLSPCMWL